MIQIGIRGFPDDKVSFMSKFPALATESRHSANSAFSTHIIRACKGWFKNTYDTAVRVHVNPDRNYITVDVEDASPSLWVTVQQIEDSNPREMRFLWNDHSAVMEILSRRHFAENELITGMETLTVDGDREELVAEMKRLQIESEDRLWSDPIMDRIAPNIYRIDGYDVPFTTLRRAKEVSGCHPDCDAIVLQDGLYYLRHVPDSDRRPRHSGTLRTFSKVVLYPQPGAVTWLKVCNKRKRIASYE